MKSLKAIWLYQYTPAFIFIVIAFSFVGYSFLYPNHKPEKGFTYNGKPLDSDTKYKQDKVDEYDLFYGDCKDYFIANKTILENKVEETCKSLEGFSKSESKDVIYDLEHPSKDDQPTKDCDIRGCTYSN